ncbi:Chemotaxis protein methyltransferase CheR [Dissulfuribacter thermophilus]|uniref:protein-glutamate O-methyltransferase n=1 Tax=Dissulfuribacter thermophilus TaxID=1156395 RepID=A0A1B9F3L5_9BACT|nr:protein-glutamate O-methyltransferase CheR [Dissulfuribacter thermophilus]OCC14529.1 Chemotaxis protein methyltransferase CheR [Dissulfuribacter thermophilus]
MDQTEKEALDEIVRILEQWSGCPFSHFKKGTLIRRIKRRLILTRKPTFSIYLDYLKMYPVEFQHLFDSLTIKVSSFFRDPEVFEAVEHGVLPLLFNRIKKTGRGQLRTWSVASAKGEEAYSMGILLCEFMKNNAWARDIPVSVIGSDIDSTAVRTARRGIYKREDLAIALTRYPQYFKRIVVEKDELYEVHPALKKIVSFLTFDCTNPEFKSPPGGVFAEYDIILLRNVLIYYDNEIKERIFKRVFECLKPMGFLILGKSEVMPKHMEKYFKTFSRGHKIYLRGDSSP